MTAAHVPSVDLDGLMRVLGEHLYSTPTVAVRELVQNAHDSISRRRILSGGTGPSAPMIELRTDGSAHTLTITDNGAGLTDTEIVHDLARIGAGQTRLVRAATGDDGLIGQFGLGFLSAFAIADVVQVDTTPFADPTQRWRYRSAGGASYELIDLADGTEHTPGSTVTLALKDAQRDLADTDLLIDVLRRYCCLLAEPITVVTVEGRERVNGPPPWRDEEVESLPPAQRRAAWLAFAARFEPSFEPLCTIEVVPFGDSDARGVLWVQGGSSYGSSDNRRMSVFLRGMLLDDDARDLLPAWAGFVGGVIESTALIPTASREDIQRTPAYDSIRESIAETLIVGLAELARSSPATWQRITARHNEALLGAALVDERLFAIIADEVTVPSTQGDRRVSGIVRDGRVHVGTLLGGGFEETLFRALKVPIARGERYAVAPFVRRWCARRGVELVEIGTEAGNRAMFREVEVAGDDLRFLTTSFAGANEEVVTARFAPDALALVGVTDREAELKQRIEDDDAQRRIGLMALQLARMYTDGVEERPARRLYINLDNPAVAAVIAAHLMGNPHTGRAVALLRATKVMLDTTGGGDLVAALDVVTRTVEHLLESTTGTTVTDNSREA